MVVRNYFFWCFFFSNSTLETEFHHIMKEFEKLFMSDPRFAVELVEKNLDYTTPHGKSFIGSVAVHRVGTEPANGEVNRVDLKFDLRCKNTNQRMTLIMPLSRRGLIIDDAVFGEMDKSTYVEMGTTKSYHGLDQSKGGMWYYMMTRMGTSLPGMVGGDVHPFFRAVHNKYFI